MPERKPNKKLQYQRELRGWSQQKVAEEIGTSGKNVGRWERGENVPDTYYRERLCALFEKDAIELGFIDVVPSEPRSSLPHNEQVVNSSSLLQDPSAINYQALKRYVLQQREYMLNALAPGSTNLWVRDIVGNDGLFIPPPWNMLQGTAASTNLVEFLIDALFAGQQILLLGDAGQGKTTIMKQVFTLMVDRFLDVSGDVAPLPLYIPLREFPSLTGNAVELLWNHISDDFPLAFEEFALLVRNKRIIFLFDGFDEIKGELTQRSINERAASKVFARPSILSCRKSFFDFYLSMSILQEYYPQWIELQPLAITRSVTRYIEIFCQQKQRKAVQKRIITSNQIIDFIGGSNQLRDLAQRPLLLIMLLDIFTDLREVSETEWNAAMLYKKYTEKWLKNESAKPDSVLKWSEKAFLLEELAWLTYRTKSLVSSPYRLNESVTFTLSETAAFVKKMATRYPHIREIHLLDDLCLRTLLTVSEGENYYFIHKSFQEYYVARYIFDCIRGRNQYSDAITAVENVLQEFLPFEVVAFLKQMLEVKELSRHDEDLAVDILIKVCQLNEGDDSRSVTIRQHASHYLSLLGTLRAVQFLEQACEKEPNKWVQRGMMVGLVLYCQRTDILERYINIAREDSEAASINLGYHLVYYGDQVQEFGYHDQGGEHVEGTVRALFRHLRYEQYKNGWPLDILTLSTLIERRGRSILSSLQPQLPFLQEFLYREHQEQSDIFQREIERLKSLLQPFLIEGESHGN